MESLARPGALAAPRAQTRVPWTTAGNRAVSTLKEAVGLRRQVVEAASAEGCTGEDKALWLQHACANLAQRLRLEVKVHGEAPAGPCVLVANHMSYLDPIAIARSVPLGAVAKSEILGWPALGDTLHNLGIIFVRRGNVHSGAVALRKSMRLLDAGVPVLVFPEGTTTFGDDVLPFRRGAFGVARLLGVPVVPVALRYGSRDVCWVGSAGFVPHFVCIHRHPRLDAELHFRPALQPDAFPNATSLAKAARRSIRSVLLP